MLVITRKLEEAIIINEDIEIVVLSIEDGKVRLGIEAPRDKKIYRKEIYTAIKKENQEALNINKDILNLLPKKS